MKDIVLANSPEEVEITKKIVAEREYEVYRQLGIIKDKILGPDGEVLEDETRQLFVRWKPIREKVIQLVKDGQSEEAVFITKAGGADHVFKLESKMLELSRYARSKADQFHDQAVSKQKGIEYITLILTVLGVSLSVIIALNALFLVKKTEGVLKEEKDKLQQALNEIKTLQGIIPMCSICKQIRDDEGLWKRVEEYFFTHSGAEVSHSICPGCMEKHYSEYMD